MTARRDGAWRGGQPRRPVHHPGGVARCRSRRRASLAGARSRLTMARLGASASRASGRQAGRPRACCGWVPRAAFCRWPAAAPPPHPPTVPGRGCRPVKVWCGALACQSRPARLTLDGCTASADAQVPITRAGQWPSGSAWQRGWGCPGRSTEALLWNAGPSGPNSVAWQSLPADRRSRRRDKCLLLRGRPSKTATGTETLTLAGCSCAETDALSWRRSRTLLARPTLGTETHTTTSRRMAVRDGARTFLCWRRAPTRSSAFERLPCSSGQGCRCWFLRG